MADSPPFDFNEWLSLLDLDAIPDPRDKLRECEFFFDLLSQQTERDRFRWLVAAFLNAAYSFFESSSLTAYFRFNDHETGEPVEDSQALEVLRRYVNVMRDAKRPNFVKTGGLVPLTKQLYDFRKKSTHYYPLSLMATGPSLPEDYHFGSTRGKGTPVMALCRDVLGLIQRVQQEIDE
ncbi:MAG: hypothetical protein Q7S69_06210 [Nitrosomonadaceae bacterium]|nr:hypothetical protein [Nitrosomonadaceae bacterium]